MYIDQYTTESFLDGGGGGGAGIYQEPVFNNDPYAITPPPPDLSSPPQYLDPIYKPIENPILSSPPQLDPIYSPIETPIGTPPDLSSPPQYVDPGGVVQESSGNTSQQRIFLILNFLDGKTGEAIGVSGKLINLADGSTLSEISDSTQAQIEVWDVPPSQLRVQFYKRGYESISLNVSDLYLQTNPIAINFTRSKNFPILELLALIALIAFVKKKKKQVGKVTTQDVFPFLLIGGGLLAFSLVKKILEFLGVWESQDSKNLDEQETNPNSPWSPLLWQKLQSQGVTWSYAITYDQAAKWVSELQDAFGPWNDCEECAKAIFHNFHTKANVSFFADVFERITGQDLLSYLRGGFWPQDRLSDTDVSTISYYVKNLKEY